MVIEEVESFRFRERSWGWGYKRDTTVENSTSHFVLHPTHLSALRDSIYSMLPLLFHSVAQLKRTLSSPNVRVAQGVTIVRQRYRLQYSFPSRRLQRTFLEVNDLD